MVRFPIKFEIDKSDVFQLRRIALVVFLVIGATLTETGCLIIPVPSVTPDHRSGIIEDETLESLIGLTQSEVKKRIGNPNYSGHLAQSYVMVYQGETRHSTDVYVFISAGYSGGASKLDDGTTTTLYCYVIEFDASRVARDFEVIVRPASGITRREDSGYSIKPAVDCSKVVWAAFMKDGVLPDDVEASK